MPVDTLEFVQLEQKLRRTKTSSTDFLAPELGKAYVIAICRDGCPNCEDQKPKLDKLAAEMTQKHKNMVVFRRIHVKYAQDSKEESSRAKDVFHHYFYPTNLILIRSRDRGGFELYRNAGPEMIELEKNIESAIETAALLAKEE